MPNRMPNQSSDVDTPDATDRVDEASAESMVASDPPAYGGVSGVGAPPVGVGAGGGLDRVPTLRCSR